MEAKGFVSLIGAGPGDPGLLTLQGAASLAAADTVVYDYLANPALLAHAQPEAEQIYVGKRLALTLEPRTRSMPCWSSRRREAGG